MTSEKELIRTDIEGYLRRYQGKELLRFVAVGSVDDGKSTLIGRLLYDTGSVYEDQLAAVRKATTMEGTEIDLSLITDGLAAEREQGITIDVAYRYFTTDRRKFIIADTPGHVQYTRNMVTGASTANVAIILIDSRLGVLEQSRRHAYIASLLGIPHLAVCVNKMDLVAYDKAVFERIKAEFSAFTANLSFTSVTFFPISALAGVNCVKRGAETTWYQGPTVLEFLETVPVHDDRDFEHFRFPVQYVLRPNLDYRGFAGQVVAGVVKKGDAITVLPSGKTSRVRAIDTFEGELDEAFVPQSVTIRLEDEVDVSRGDMLVLSSDLPRVAQKFEAHVVWMHETALDPGRSYLLKHTTQTVRVDVAKVHWKKDMATLAEVATESLGLNDIGRLSLTAHRPLFLDGYADDRATGSFILIDSITNNTVAAGMVIAEGSAQDRAAALRAASGAGEGIAHTQVSVRERRERFGQHGVAVLVVGRPASGAEALAFAIERKLFDGGHSGSVVPSTDEASLVAGLSAVKNAGLVAVAAVPALPSSSSLAKLDGVVTVHVTTPEAVCRSRRADADFSRYVAPAIADVSVDLASGDFEAATDLVVRALADKGAFA